MAVHRDAPAVERDAHPLQVQPLCIPHATLCVLSTVSHVIMLFIDRQNFLGTTVRIGQHCCIHILPSLQSPCLA